MANPSNAQDDSTVLIVQQVLNGLSLGSLPAANTTWPIFLLVKPDSPDNAIIVYETEPISQGRYMIGGASVERKGIQIQVRSASPITGDTKVRAIAVALTEGYQNQEIEVNDNTYIVPSFSVSSGPLPLGREIENSRRWIHTLNLTTPIYQQSS